MDGVGKAGPHPFSLSAAPTLSLSLYTYTFLFSPADIYIFLMAVCLTRAEDGWGFVCQAAHIDGQPPGQDWAQPLTSFL